VTTSARGAWIAASIALVSLAGPARAEKDAHPKVVVRVDPCVQVSSREVRRIVAVELGTLLVGEAQRSADTTLVTVRCAASSVSVHVDDPVTKKALDRAIDLEAHPAPARARLLALAIAELVTASWTELESNPRPAAPPAGPEVTPALRQAAREIAAARSAAATRSPMRFVAAAAVRSYLGHGGPLVGADLRAAQDIGLLGWSVDAGFDRGSRTFAPGRIATTTVALAPMLTISTSLSSLVLRGGAGARGGLAVHEGQRSDTRVREGTVAGPFLGPALQLGATAVPARPICVELTLAGGFVALPVAALIAGKEAVSVEGVWLGATLGVGVVR
jgi:hypothetical protein